MSQEQNKVVILQSQEEQRKPSKWSFKRYGKGILFGKWAILASVVVMGVGGYLGFRFVLNPLREKVTSSFHRGGGRDHR